MDLRANAQLFDASSQIANQVDLQVFRDLGTAALLNAQEAVKEKEAAAAPEPVRDLTFKSAFDELIGPDWTSQGIFFNNTFDEKNSFTGKGVSDSFGTQLGWGFQTTDQKTTIQPYLVYNHSNTDLVGNNSSHANAYGFTLNMAEELLPNTPLLDRGPDAVTGPKALPPYLGITGGLNFAYLDTNVANYGSGWSYDTQDSYSLAPNVAFNYVRRASNEFPDEPHDAYSGFPNAVSLIPGYAYNTTDARMGSSSSTGQFSLQDRNTWAWEFGTNEADKRTLQLQEINTWYRDTNQEMLMAPTGHLEYQNWVRFGFAISYADFSPTDFKVPSVKLEYDYDAFNNQFEQHIVTLNINIKF